MRSCARRPSVLNFGAYDSSGQLRGYARVVTDGVTFAWLCDVYWTGVSRQRPRSAHLAGGGRQTRTHEPQAHPLMTSYSHSLYERVGFERCAEPGKVMAYNGGR